MRGANLLLSKLLKVIYSKKSKKFIEKNKKDGLKFFKAFDEISQDLENIKYYDIKNLKTKENIFRLRIGKFRALFSKRDDQLIILVINIGSRGEIYNDL